MVSDIDITESLKRLAKAYPTEHPYTLALRLQAETGEIITGKRAREILEGFTKDDGAT